MTTGAVSRAKLQSNRHHQQTNTKLFTGRMPMFLLPNQQRQSTEGKRQNLRYLNKKRTMMMTKQKAHHCPRRERAHCIWIRTREITVIYHRQQTFDNGSGTLPVSHHIRQITETLYQVRNSWSWHQHIIRGFLSTATQHTLSQLDQHSVERIPTPRLLTSQTMPGNTHPPMRSTAEL